MLFWGGFGISSGAKNKDAAWRFLRYYVGEEGARGLEGLGAAVSGCRSHRNPGKPTDPIEGVWLNELNHLAPRAYTFTPYLGRDG